MKGFGISGEACPDNVEAWRTALARALGPLEVAPTNDTTFGGHVRSIRRGQIQFNDIAFSGQRAERTSENLSHAKTEVFILTRPLSSPLHWKTSWGQGDLKKGLWYLAYHSMPFKFEFVTEGTYRTLGLCLPAAALRQRDPRIGYIHAIPFDSSSARAQLLHSYIHHMEARLECWSDTEFAGLCERLYDLIALLMLTGEHSDFSMQEGSIKMAHRERAIAYIKTHLGDPELNAEKVAYHCHISPSYLRQVFALAGLTVENFIYAQRIEKCREFLIDPYHRQKSIAQLAYQTGFRNTSHFSRLFKDRVGVSPKEYRERGTLPIAPDSSSALTVEHVAAGTTRISSFQFDLPRAVDTATD